MGMDDAPRCTYIKATGHRCGSPALRGEHFCFFHTRMVKGVRYRVDMRTMPLAVLEDAESVQVALMDVVSQLLDRNIEWREASLIIRALEIGARNVRRVQFGQNLEKMVRQLPNWEAQFFDEYPQHAPENWEEERKQVSGIWGHEPAEEKRERGDGRQESAGENTQQLVSDGESGEGAARKA